MKRLLGLLIVCFVLAIANIPANAQNLSNFTETDCWFGGSIYRINCGYVTVPEDHNNLDGKTIELAVAIIRSRNPDKKPDPFLFISGGPGHAFVNIAPTMASQFGIPSILMNRDVILVDQRGMGLSKPNLVCNPFRDSSEIFPTPLVLASLIQRMTRCPSEFEAAGINWRAYTTEQNAADLAMIPQALGYESYNLYGVSYGSMPAQVILRDYPEHVRSAVLDSVASLDSNMFEDSPFGFQQSFAVMEAHCEADFACRLAYPNIRETFYETFYRLKENPVSITISGVEVSITGETFASIVNTQLRSKRSFQTVPGLITAFAVEDYDVAIPFLKPLVNLSVDNMPNQALYMTIACPQSAPYTNADAINESLSKYDEPFRAAGLGVSNFIQCHLWTGIPPQSLELAKSDIPTLVLAGEFDPATPPESAIQAAQYLSNSTVLELPYTGHVVAESPCGQELIVKFIDNPTQMLDTSCLDSISAPGFVLHTTVTRPPIQVALVILGVIALFGLGRMLFAGIKGFRRIAWRASFRRLGYMPFIAAGLLYFLIVVNAEVLPSVFMNLGVLQSMMPIFIALQAAAIFSAGDEPSLEIQLALPRSLSWLVLERLLAVVISYGLIAVGAVVLSLWRDPAQDFVMLAFSWISPALFLSGLGMFITIRSRNVALGVMAIGFLWFMFALFSSFLLPGQSFAPPMHLVQPFLWPFHVHATLDDLSLLDYGINRLFMVSTGIGLIMAAIRGLRDPEEVLGNSGSRKTQRKVATTLPTVHSLNPQLVLHTVKIQINALLQIWGIVKYECVMRWRSRGMKVFILVPLAVFGLFMIVMANDSSGMMTTVVSRGIMPDEQSALVRGESLVFFAAAIFFVPVIYLFPVLVADTVTADEQKGVKEILSALPLSDSVYLIGKMLGALLAGFIGQAIAAIGIGVIYYFWVGAYYPVPYIDMLLGLFIVLVLLTCFAVLIGASQRSGRRAVAVVIALLIMPEFFQSIEFIQWLTPSRVKFLMIFIASSSEATTVYPLSTHGLVVFDPQFLELVLTSFVQLIIVGVIVGLWRRYRSQD